MSSFEQPGLDPSRFGGAHIERRSFADQLSIETPEQVALEFPVAGIGSRFVALLLDHLVQIGTLIALALIVALVSAAAGERGMQTLPGKWFLAGFFFLLFLLYWGYFALFEAFWRGQTPGKRIMRIRVIKDAGRQITLFEALARNFLRVVDYLPSMYLAGLITMLCNKRNKRLGDLAAGTMVVHERGDEQPLLHTGASPASTGSLFASSAGFRTPPVPLDPWRPAPGTLELFPPDATVRLGPQDLVIIEAFFARALDLPLETRAAMAHRILGEMSAKMGVPAPEGNPERALEAIATALRGRGRRF